MIRDEETLLARALAALARAGERRRTRAGLRDPHELRELRDQAIATCAVEDLPSVLHEMSVRHQLMQRAPDDALPDPASPYVAHLRVADERGERDYLLGHASFVDAKADVRIVDWRTAPIAQVFYRYREGDEYEEEIAGRTLEGVVLVRNVVVIEEGRLTRVLAGSATLARRGDAWVREDAPELAAGGAGVAPRALGVGIGAGDRGARADVTALLDAEQHAAISLPADEPLLVIGSAGSGKTTVALHRLARIAAVDEARPIASAGVIVPEEGLARLSRRLLAPFGVSERQVRTLDAWALALAREVFGSVPRIGDETPAVVARLKRHPALFDGLAPELDRLAPTRSLRKLQRAVALRLSDRTFLARVIDASEGDLPRGAIEETVRHTMRQLAEPPEKQLADITDEEAKRTIDGLEVWESTPEATAGSIDLEDLPIFLYARARHAAIDSDRLAHLVVDEAEDVSLFELAVLRRSLDRPPSVTLAGDDAQRTFGAFAGWERALSALGVSGATTCRLEISYRCPRPIVELAQAVLGAGDRAAARAAREGAPVSWLRLPSEAHAQLALASALRELVESEPRASIAVIASEPEAARRTHAALSDVPSTRLVIDGDFTFAPGVDVTHVDAVKGLEFDYVVIPDATREAYPDEPEASRRLHVAITRASWQLFVVVPGAPSPLLPSA